MSVIKIAMRIKLNGNSRAGGLEREILIDLFVLGKQFDKPNNKAT